MFKNLLNLPLLRYFVLSLHGEHCSLKCILVQKVGFLKYKSGILHGYKMKIWLLFYRSMNTFGSTVANTCPYPQPLRASSHDRNFLSSSYRSRIDFEAF